MFSQWEVTRVVSSVWELETEGLKHDFVMQG